jgi:hypothetical protein
LIGLLSSFWTWHGWSFFVALGTLSLAFFTWRVARQARQQIELQTREVKAVERQTHALAAQTEAVQAQAVATARQAEISAASLEAASRPVLVGAIPELSHPVPTEELELVEYWDGHSASVYPGAVHYAETDEMVYCSIPLRNVGAGVAFIKSVTLMTQTEFPGRVSSVVVRRDEVTRANFGVARRRPDGSYTDVQVVTRDSGRALARFTVQIVCTGASRGLRTITEITTAELPSGSFLFTDQRVWDGERDDDRLLVSTDNIG